jgi:hypothetical protein
MDTCPWVYQGSCRHRWLPTYTQTTDADLQYKRHKFINTSAENIPPSVFIMFERDDISSFKIPSTSSHKQNSHNVTWHGACVDTGAQKTVIGLPQAKAYCRFIGTKFKLKENRNVYQFGVIKQESLGSLKVILPTPEPLINLEIDVVQADVPLLIGLDVLYENGMTADTLNNFLKCPGRGWKIPLVRKLGHVYLEWE